jgi:hypothetical protein
MRVTKINHSLQPSHRIQQHKQSASWILRHRLVVDESVTPGLEAAVKRQASFGHMFLRLCYQDRAYLEQVRHCVASFLLYSGCSDQFVACTFICAASCSMR